MAEPHGNVHFNYFNIITPPMYNGSGNPSNWLLYFRKWIKINSIANENACHYLPFYLKESAKVWFDGLHENIQNSTENLEIGLIERFSRDEDDIELDVKQKENESVLEFFDRLRIIAKDLEIPENLEFIMGKKGLLPKLNNSITLSNPKNLNKLKQAAIIAEKCANVRKTIKDSDCSNLNVIKQNKDLDEITEKINTLNLKIKEQMPQVNAYRSNRVNRTTKQNYVCKYCEYNKANINYPTKTLNLYDGIAQIALISTRQNEAKTLIHIELPARKISIIPVKIPKQFVGKQIILEPSQSLHNKSIVGAACLVSSSTQQAVMQVINPNEDKVVLNRNEIVALISEIKPNSIQNWSDKTEKVHINNIEKGHKNQKQKLNIDLSEADLTNEQKIN
ncbi:unnamed protein product [Mytilus edulis]|uniref:Retrotransposon gag domain-containing protein n=1 Tax=Mytilus edulis TaxID=6550 RepID=A0A8S3QTK5_MYTED|nr:unnamed protein product [Mytilus edulis]